MLYLIAEGGRVLAAVEEREGEEALASRRAPREPAPIVFRYADRPSLFERACGRVFGQGEV